MLKFRLFCYVSGIFMMAGLLLPVGVYAEDSLLNSPTVQLEATSVADDTTCPTNALPAAVAAAGLTDESTPAAGEAPQSPAPCGDDDEGNPASVSWNS